MQDLLFLSHRIPYPPDKGDKIRAWHMLRHLARTHRVHVGCFVDDAADWAHVPALREQCASLACVPLRPLRQKARALATMRPGRPLTLAYFDSARLRRWVDETLARTGLARAFVSCAAMAPYVLRADGVRRVLDFIDVDSSKWTEYARHARWPARAVWAREGRTLLAFERQAAARFDHGLFVSESELRHFHALAPEAAGRTSAVSNGVDLRYFSPDHALANPYPVGDRTIVFTGAMDYRPNVDAVVWFAHEVLPLLSRDLASPPPCFWIVGANPSDAVRRLAAPGRVTVTGRVADIRPYLSHADAVVAPLRIARGIQNKVLEAMAMGRPVVATPQAHEGLRAVPGRDLLLAGTAAETAGDLADILAGLHPGLGMRARRMVETEYDWARTLAPLDGLWAPGPVAGGAGAATPMAQPGGVA